MSVWTKGLCRIVDYILTLMLYSLPILHETQTPRDCSCGVVAKSGPSTRSDTYTLTAERRAENL